VGADFSSEMLQLAAGKIRRAGLANRVRLLRGDATSVPFAEGTFDAAMVAFGIRNVLDPDAACREFRRVLRPGGRLAILEFGAPRVPGLRTLYLSYFRYVLPAIGRIVSKHQEAYEYLPASVMAFPTGEAFADRLRDAGFATVTFRRLMGGIVYLYVAARD
jgi:demethylmenaquinone methyltransferase/2-methoxy-6-polyprenyl-1,4-benzoquinol methylase